MPRSQVRAVEQLTDLVRALDITRLDPVGVRQLLVAADQLGNAAEALAARAMVQMHREARADDARDAALAESVIVPTGVREEFVVDEIAAHLRCTRMAASHRFALALAAHDHAPLGTAWAAGRLDARKVQVVAELLGDIDPVLAETLASAAVAYADTHTGPQLRAWLSRHAMRADPRAAEQRRDRATAGRRVTLRPMPDGVAELAALMPAVQARHLYDTLTAAAHATDRTDDDRTLDQRRSDALYDLVTGRAEPPAVHLNITVPADTLVGTSAQPAALAGHGPITADTVRDLLRGPDPAGAELGAGIGQVLWRRLLTDPATGILTDLSEKAYRPSRHLDRAVRARDVTCRFPGCRRPASAKLSGVDLDHTVPAPTGPTAAANLACLCRHHHRLKHSPGWQLTLDPDGTCHWTTPTGHSFTTTPWRYRDPPALLDQAA